MPRKLPIERTHPRQQATRKDIHPEVEAQISYRNEREAARKREERPRASYDLPKSLIDWVKEQSERHSIPRSAIAEMALVLLRNKVDEGEVSFERYKVESDSLRFRWTMEIPEDFIL